ncbi:hypothetical protein ACHAXT_007922 [Thalassiosira profunda]
MSLLDDSRGEGLLGSNGGGPSHPQLPGGENPQEAPPASTSASALSDTFTDALAGDLPLPDDDRETFVQKYLSRIITAILALSLIGLVFVLMPIYAVHAAKNERWNETLYWTAGAFVLVAVPVSVYGIVQHLVNYYMPQVQKYVIRILFMVPVFSIQAWFSLFFHSAAPYIRVFRELYEAFVLSSFVYYIIELLGGDDQLALTLRTKDGKHGHHPLPFRCICKEWQMGRQFLINCKYGVLQYVLVKILATIAVIILSAKGMWNSGTWAWDSAWTYIAVSMNVSIGYALYCLVKLYYATKEDLKEWNPVWKFLCIKGIIFFTFWQGFIIECLHSAGVITDVGGWDSEHVADGLQDLLISFEMVGFAILHRYAFPHTDYIHYLRRHGKRSRRRRGGAAEPLEETVFLFDQDHNAVHDQAVDVEYQPPSVRQLDRPLSVSRALMGVVPRETISDIARMSMGGSVTVSEGGGSSRGGASSTHSDIVISREHAEGI